MSCIPYVCNCLYEKGQKEVDFDFENERFVNIIDLEQATDYCEFKVPEMYDYFVGIILYILTIYDVETYFCFCSRCLVELFEKYNISNKSYASKYHDKCIQKILTYLYERIEKQIEGQYIFHYWDLCRHWLVQLFHKIKGDLLNVFHTNIRE